MTTAALLLSLALAASGGGSGKVFLDVDEALKLAFPECVVERTTEVLSETEEARVESLAGAELESRIVHPYVARKDGKLVGTAYFDAHRVRTKNEVLMLVVGPDERLKRVEVLSFAEPLEYLPRATFYAQFQEKRLDERLDVARDIRGVAGATLSAEAATHAARRTLALQHVLAERKSVEPLPSPAPAPAPTR
jgi:hypothetical protein